MNSIKSTSSITFTVGFITAVFTQQSYATNMLAIEYNSKYISEGRNNLEQGGIVWATAETALSDSVSFQLLYGLATDGAVQYDELVGSLIYSAQLEQFDYSIGLSRLAFLKDKTFDNELTLSISREYLNQIYTAANFIYSTQQQGTFIEVEFERSITLTQRMTLTPFTKLGFDLGYITPEHNTQNHTSFGAAISYQFANSSSLAITAQYDVSGTDIKRELGAAKDQFWVAVNVSNQFSVKHEFTSITRTLYF